MSRPSGKPVRKVVTEGRFLRFVRIGTWEAVERTSPRPAVGVAALTVDGEMVLVEQWRPPMGSAVIEIPAGLVGDLPGKSRESSASAARRELLEETGFRAREWARAGQMHLAIAYSTEVIHIYFARGLTQGERQLDAGEFLDVFTATPEELMAWCRDGQVTDAKTLSCMVWVHNVLSGVWPLNWQACEPIS